MSIGGGTPRAEALLEEKRRVLRNALKGEYIRKKYNPAAYTADGGKNISKIHPQKSLQMCRKINDKFFVKTQS